MSWTFLNVEAVQALQSEQIARFGGSPGLRDAGLLESAVHRAESKANYDPEATTASLAASLAWGLVRNHAFMDGNKRVGLVSMVVFLRINGYGLTCPASEETEMVLRVAAGAISEDEWTAWVERSVAPLSS